MKSLLGCPAAKSWRLAAQAAGAVVIAPQFTEQDIAQQGYLSDWNDLATKTTRAAEIPAILKTALAAAESERLKWAEAKDQVVGEGKTRETEEDQEEIQSNDDDQWSLTAGLLEQKQESQALKPPAPKEPAVPGQNEWHFRVTPKGEIEHYRVATGIVGVRETADKIHILEQSDDAFVLALERAQSRFGQHLHFNGSQAGVERLVRAGLTRP